MEVNKNAPLVHSESIEIEAPIQEVWEVLTDFAHWPEWNKSIVSMDMHGPLQVGTNFFWKSGSSRLHSKIVAIESGRMIAWAGATMGIKAVHVYRFRSEDDKTIVTTEESWEGWSTVLFRGSLRKVLARSLREGLERLKVATEVP